MQCNALNLRRWSSLALLAAVIGTMLTAGWSVTPAHAQETQEATTEATPDESAAPAPAGTDTAPVKVPESFLSWMIRASGIFGFLIMIASFIMVALIVMNILQLRRDNFTPPDFLEGFEQKLQAKEYQPAYEQAKVDESLAGRMLTAGMSRLSRGYDEAVEGMQEVMDDESMALEHKLSYLALIGTIAPMLGLLGTVQGMIMSFQVIANSATTPKPSELADGISTALFTTLEGLVVAIPAMIAFGILKNRMARLLLETGMIAENLMSRFSPSARGGQAGTTAAPRTSGAPATATTPAAKME